MQITAIYFNQNLVRNTVMVTLLTLHEVEERAKRSGVAVPARTLWEYLHSGLLPQGHKIPGRGNVLYYPDDTADRLIQVYWLNKKMGIPIGVLRNSVYLAEGEQWDSSVVRRQPSPLDLIVSWAGVMANMRLMHKPTLDHKDLGALFGRLKKMFEKLGIREPTEAAVPREPLHE
jgi:hypothetical protein